MKFQGPVVRFLLTAAIVTISALITFVSLYVPAPVSALSSNYLIIINAFGTVLLFIVTVAYFDIQRREPEMEGRANEKYSRILHRLDVIFNARTGLSTYFLKYEQSSAGIEGQIREASSFLQFLADETCSIFEDYTSQSCAVAIKLLVPSDSGRPSITTYLRDRRSQLSRNNLYGDDGTYPFDDHTPFVKIITAENSKDYFVCNDLAKAASNREYQNSNKLWRRFYNATLVVPIKEPSMLSRENVLGFLCVDSIDGEFDESASLHLARIVANTVYYVIYSISELEKKRVEQVASQTKQGGVR